MEAEKSCKRRRYTRELKDQIIAECEVPGALVAKVALSHGINANIVHSWRKLAGRVVPAVVRPEFVPVAVASAAQVRVDERIVEMELRRGAVVVKMRGGFNLSTQHTSHCSGSRSVANEVPDTDLLHRRSKGIDVGALEGRMDAT